MPAISVHRLIWLTRETFFHFSGEETEAWAGVLLIRPQVSGVGPQVSRPGPFPAALPSQAAQALPGSSLEHGLGFLDSSRAALPASWSPSGSWACHLSVSSLYV